MKILLILITFVVSFNASASRLIEVEDYYSEKASDFIKTRYPRKAFSVYVKVDAEEKPQVRQPANDQKMINLPYFDQVRQQEISFWDRKDVSLGTLISYLKSIFIKVDIDGDFSDEEIQKFKAELFQHLKLSEVYDRVEINRRQWHSGFSLEKNKMLLGVGLAFLLLLVGTFFAIFQTGVRSLVKGLSQPLSEIGRSAENVANSSGMGVDTSTRSSFQLENQRWEEGQLSAEQIENAKVEIHRLSQFLSLPSGEVIQKVEELGAQDPFAMGAVLAEMKIEDLNSLVQWSRGDWWRIAITQPTPLSRRSLEFVSELSHLYIRQHLLKAADNKSESEQKFNRVLARLSVKQFGELLENYKFEQSESVLRSLPQETMIHVAKYLYPGRWAELLEEKSEEKSIDHDLMSEIESKALKICPLKNENELKKYFSDADLLKFLDSSATKDERDVYKALASDSWIKLERTAFFEVFNQSEEVMQQLAVNLPLELWALAITSCDRQECDQLYKFFTAKQKFVLREYKNKYLDTPPLVTDVVRAKKRILHSLLQIKNHLSRNADEGAQYEAAA